MNNEDKNRQQIQEWYAALSSFGKLAYNVKKVFEDSIAPALFELAKAIDRLPEDLKPVIRSLAERGWFISGEMGFSEIRNFQSITESSNFEAVDTVMSEWIEENLQEILVRANQLFPERNEIISAAFFAHKSNLYELSIPVILAQVEGMCIEVLKTKLFATRNGVPVTKEATEALINSAYSEVILLPLRVEHGLIARESTRDNWPDAPNRHEILHGISTDYPKKLNSQKAISLLEYFVTFVVPRVGQ